MRPRRQASNVCRRAALMLSAGPAEPRGPPQKERGSSLRWSPSTVGALPGMCPNRSSGRDLVRSRPGENSHIVSALRVLGDVEAFAFDLNVGAQADDDIDDLVEDRGA